MDTQSSLCVLALVFGYMVAIPECYLELVRLVVFIERVGLEIPHLL